VHVVAGEAPECLAALPDPDAVFIGGNGGQLLSILENVHGRLKPGGRLVLSCIALETLSQAWNWLSERGLQPEAASLQLAYSRPLGKLHCLEPEHPIILLRVKLP
jgi:precorrin-6B C5,15-methyltransferase / cobalt-precorrin-6B C5,C15-methyltransferase